MKEKRGYLMVNKEIDEVGDVGEMGWFRMDISIIRHSHLTPIEKNCLLLAMTIAHEIAREPTNEDLKKEMRLKTFEKMKKSLLKSNQNYFKIISKVIENKNKMV
jgi:hypothetical protein